MNLNSRTKFIASAFAWAVTVVALSLVQRRYSVPTRLSTYLLLAALGLALWSWSQRRHPNDAALRLTWFGLVAAVIVISSWIVRDWGSLIILIWYVWAIRESIGDAVGAEGKIRAVAVSAVDLSGTVEYDSMHFSGVLVEEYSSAWTKCISEAKTNDEGRFELPHSSEDPTHFVKVSWPGTCPVYLRVQIAPEAQPLLIHLKPMKQKRLGNWGE
jgi:hypothetical protein